MRAAWDACAHCTELPRHCCRRNHCAVDMFPRASMLILMLMMMLMLLLL